MGGHVGNWNFRREDQGIRVATLGHADLIRPDGTLGGLGVVLDDARPVPGEVPGVLGIGAVAEGLDEVIGGDVGAVAPLQALLQGRRSR